VLYSWGTLQGFILGRGESETELIRPTYSERINRTGGSRAILYTRNFAKDKEKFGPTVAKRKSGG
jgi:hypothetical protein